MDHAEPVFDDAARIQLVRNAVGVMFNALTHDEASRDDL